VVHTPFDSQPGLPDTVDPKEEQTEKQVNPPPEMVKGTSGSERRSWFVEEFGQGKGVITSF